MHQALADTRFGLDRHAWTLLNLLSTMTPDFAEFLEEARMYDVCIQTTVFVKGSNRWIALVLYPQLVPSGPSKVMLLGQDSITDELYVEDWQPSVRDTAPAPDDPHAFTVHRFPLDRLPAAAQFVKDRLATAYGSLRVARGVLQVLG